MVRDAVVVSLTALAVTGVVLALLWVFVGPPSYDSIHHDHNCWRCFGGIGVASGIGSASAQAGWVVSDSEFVLHDVRGTWGWERAPEDHAGYGPFLVGVAMVAPDEGWVVSDAIFHYRGGSWTTALDLSQQTVLLEGVAAASSTEAWAVGGSWYDDFGFIWRYQEGVWTKVYTGANMNIVSVSAPIAGEAWAVGIRYYGEDKFASSVLLGYQHGLWTEAFTTPLTLHAVAMVSPTEGWATGADTSGVGVLLHYMSGAWTQETFAPSFDLCDLAMASADQGWASGVVGVTEPVLYLYHRGVWSFVGDHALSGVNYIHGIAAPAPGEAWVLGIGKRGWRDRGILLHYQGGQWTTIEIPKSPPEEAWQTFITYDALGFLLLVLASCAGALIMSLRAPKGSLWRQWAVRPALVAGICTSAGLAVTTALPLFAEDLPVDPSQLANVAAYTLFLPGIVLVALAQIVAPIARVRKGGAAVPTRK
jgi:hypothetical protein